MTGTENNVFHVEKRVTCNRKITYASAATKLTGVTDTSLVSVGIEAGLPKSAPVGAA